MKQNPTIKVGEIWSTKKNPRLPNGEIIEVIQSPHHVVVLLDAGDAYDKRFLDIRVAPISTETQYACDADLILNPTENPLGTHIMVELWNTQPMLVMNLDQRLGLLSEAIIERLDRLNQKIWGQEVALSGIQTGTSLTDPNDPRLEFQERELEATLYLRGPVNLLIEFWEQETTAIERLQETLKGVFAVWWGGQPLRAGLAGAYAAARPQPQAGQTADGSLRWYIDEDEWGALVISLGSHALELEGVTLVVKAGALSKIAVLERDDDQVGAEVTFTRSERVNLPEDALLTVDIENE